MAIGDLFCYIERAMRQFARIASPSRWSALCMALIIGALCFSVGEGLRLTPFPVSQVKEYKDLTSGNEAAGSLLAKYGPIVAPSSVQKRSKRQTTDFVCATLAADKRVIMLMRHYAADESRPLASSRFFSRSAGRAPPLVS